MNSYEIGVFITKYGSESEPADRFWWQSPVSNFNKICLTCQDELYKRL
jgi:hypothetical protein